MTQVTVGAQLGGEAFRQIIFFEDERAFKEFTSGQFEFGAQAQAVAITAGATAQATTGGTGAGKNVGGDKAQVKGGYQKGMAVFTLAKGGLMYEASIGGQKFNYTPKVESKDKAKSGTRPRAGRLDLTEENRMKSLTRAAARLLLAASACLAVASAHADGGVGSTLPADFPAPLDASLGEPLLGFGAAGTVTRTPVVFVHGNNDTPFPTDVQPVRPRAGVRAVPRRQRLRPGRVVGGGLPGRPVRLAPRPDPTLGSRPHDLRQRARRARLRARGAALHRRAPGRRGGAQPRLGDRARVAAPASGGGSLRAALRRDRRREPRDHQLLAGSAATTGRRRPSAASRRPARSARSSARRIRRS